MSVRLILFQEVYLTFFRPFQWVSQRLFRKSLKNQFSFADILFLQLQQFLIKYLVNACRHNLRSFINNCYYIMACTFIKLYVFPSYTQNGTYTKRCSDGEFNKSFFIKGFCLSFIYISWAILSASVWVVLSQFLVTVLSLSTVLNTDKSI